MQAVILAAGTGTRVMPLTRVIPKALLPIANRPLLEYALGSLEHAGLKEIVIITGYMGWKTARCLAALEEHCGAEIRYVSADKYRKGPIFSLLAAEKLIDDDFLLTPVDLILAHEIVVKLLRSSVEEKTVYVAIDDQSFETGGTLVSCYQSARGTLSSVLALGSTLTARDNMGKRKAILGTSVGIVLCPVEIFKYARVAAEKGLARVVDALNLFFSEDGRGQCVKISAEDYWFDVDTVETALSANRFILQKSLIGDKPRGKLYTNQLTFWPRDRFTVSSHSPARIMGPSIIGEGCKIGDGSSIGPYVSVQHDCSIGRDVICKNSIILGGARIGDSTVVEDAIVNDRETIFSKKHNSAIIERDGKNG